MKSTQAQTAKAVKNELKEAFPNTKFSVRSDSFASGDAVRITWIDGASMDQVREIADKYQYGHFDGMEDLYKYSNGRDDIPQVKYVTYSRSYSDETKDKIIGYIRENHANCEEFSADYYSEEFRDWGSSVIWRRFIEMDLDSKTVEEHLEDRVIA